MASDSDGDAEPAVDGDAPRGRREVVVPLRVYKTVTVFSTLIAVAFVILGFVLLDAATLQMSALRRSVRALLAGVGVRPGGDAIAGALAAIGLLSIAFGGGVYVIGTRFHPRGMGNPQEDSDEASNNG